MKTSILLHTILACVTQALVVTKLMLTKVLAYGNLNGKLCAKH